MIIGIDVIEYQNASCKTVDSAAITPKASLSSFRIKMIFFLGFSFLYQFLIFEFDIGWYINFSPSTNLSFTESKYFSLPSSEVSNRL